MMRQNLALVLVAAYALGAATVMADTKKSSPGHKRLDEMHTTQDNWDDLNSDNQLDNDKRQRPAYKPAAQPAPRPQPRSPASLAPMRAPVAPIFPVAAITFEDYVADNARNPAMSKVIEDHQLAFTDVSAPAVITMPGSDADKAASAPAPAPGTMGAAAAANPAAFQAAAAAAAAAGLIPAGTTLPAATGGGSYGTSAPVQSGPVR